VPPQKFQNFYTRSLVIRCIDRTDQLVQEVGVLERLVLVEVELGGRVRKTGGNRSGSTGSRWNRSGPVHEPVRFPPQNRAYKFTRAVNRPV
jgi:hypothetical protein